MYEEGDDTDAAVYTGKLQELKDATRAMFDRFREHRDRPEVVAAFLNAINVSNTFLNKLKNATPDERYLEDSDLNMLEKLLTTSQVCRYIFFFMTWIAKSSDDCLVRIGWTRRWRNKMLPHCISSLSSL